MREGRGALGMQLVQIQHHSLVRGKGGTVGRGTGDGGRGTGVDLSVRAAAPKTNPKINKRTRKNTLYNKSFRQSSISIPPLSDISNFFVAHEKKTWVRPALTVGYTSSAARNSTRKMNGVARQIVVWMNTSSDATMRSFVEKAWISSSDNDASGFCTRAKGRKEAVSQMSREAGARAGCVRTNK